MRRRERANPDADAPPARLVHYSPADWPDPACHPECAYWEAREQWSAKHPDVDDLFDVGGPDTPFHPELI